MTLFNRYECMTPVAQDFSERVEQMLRPMVQDMVDKGASARGLAAILFNQVDAMICEISIIRSMEIRKLEQSARKEAQDAQNYNEPAD